MQEDFSDAELYKDVFSNAPIGVYTISKSGFIETFNPKMVELSGAKSSSEVVGLNALTMKSYEKSGLVKLFSDGLKGKKFSKDVEYVSHTHKKKSFRHYRGIPIFDNNKNVKRLLLLVEDITEKKKFEAKLKKSTAELQSVSEFPNENPFPIMRISEEGKLLYANFCSNVLLESWDTKVGDNVPVRVKDVIKYNLNNKKRGVFDEAVGSKVLSFLAVPITKKGYINLYARDVTEERQAERAKTEFVSLASHQLRTPLSIINWHTEMLVKIGSNKIPDKEAGYIEEIRDASIRMNNLVNALLNVTRYELGTFRIEPQKIDIKDFIEKIKSAYEADLKDKKLNFSVEVELGSRKVNADPMVLSIILDNLISNSIKYSDEHGNIKINVEDHSNGTFMFKVSDDGFGIPESQKNQIYKKMFRADNVISKDTVGTGLGLYLVKSLVDSLNGSIDFESNVNSGTTFTVILPDIMKKRKGTSRFT